MARQEFCVLVAQHDPAVSRRIEKELVKAGVRVAGPVADLDQALARPEGQVVSVALVDLLLAEGASAVAGFRSRHPSLAVVATAPRRFEARARKAVAEGARMYLLDEEIGRGILVPVVRHLAGTAPQVELAGGAPAAASGRLLHDLGNLLAVAGGESEMLLARVKPGDPLAEDLRELNTAISESVRLFRQFIASRRVEAKEPGAENP